jgi:hypothetical protein
MGERSRGRHVGGGRAVTDATTVTSSMRVDTGPSSAGFHDYDASTYPLPKEGRCTRRRQHVGHAI